MKCPNCQTENPEGSKYCRECAQSLQLEPICPECGYKNIPGSKFCNQCAHPLTEQAAPPIRKPKPRKTSTIQPTSFADGRYQVKKLLGEGGKKKVYRAHDTLLDRDVAFALIKTEKLDDSARKRITREAQAMGRLGDHPNIGTVFDIGDHRGQPYIVQPLISGGDVEELIEKAPEHKLPLDRVTDIARAVCRGLTFAHSKGIIHRDLKPGNVMLTEDGTAKIVDFGLAVAVDLSRLTQSGMMVGTVSYMPPEQAMGGQISEKADLYSLGAMLYEMVTGRPPFVGDDSISIIGQHVNTPPISPTWHRADLPPAMETLILQLLEKDPEKRPSSASAVLEALESIDTGKVSKEATKEASTLAENPLYRKVFVGREPELKQLQSAFDGAISGQGTLMMVVGEPGIGKTAICDQLRTYVTLRGGKTLIGHCYEEGSLSLPYLAFVEAMRSYVLSREVKDLRDELGTGAADVARIVSEVREKLKVKPRPKGDPEEERYRLMQAVTGFLSNAANVQPLLVVLEDLHDSDKGTLDMLTHISRNLGGTRLLIVGTYRDVEVDRSHPLSAALAELRRVSTYGRVLLRGLNPDEVRRMLESITREEIPLSLAEAVHRQTEGNPLFVQEVVRYLVEEGLLAPQEGRYRPTKDTPLEMNIPEGLRDVIGKRLSLISKECNQLLSIAAVIGREFSLEVLKKVSGLSDDELFSACEEVKKAAVVEERTGVGATVSYRFAHAFFRQTLYEETIAPRRIQLHQQVARALEEVYASRLEDHATELAEHFSHSSDATDLEKAVSYGEMAAKRALDVYAYSEAVHLLEQALKVQRVLNPGDKGKICDLLMTLSDTFSLAGRATQEAVDIELNEAFSLAEAIGDKTRASRACQLAIRHIAYAGDLISSLRGPETARWAERADKYAEPGTAGRALADLGMAVYKYGTGFLDQQTEATKGSMQLFNRSLELAQELDDMEILCYAACFRLTTLASPQHIRERWLLAEELAARPHTGVTTRTLGTALSYAAFTLLESGKRQLAEELVKELWELSEHSGQTNLWFMAISARGMLATLDGRLEEADEIGRQARARGEELDFATYAAVCEFNASLDARFLLGKTDELAQLTEIFVPFGAFMGGLIYAILKSPAETIEYLEKNVVARPGIGTPDDETFAYTDVYNLIAAVMVGHRPSAELLLERLSDVGLYTANMMSLQFPTRHLGAAAALLERPDEARKYYQKALKMATEIRYRPEIALTRLELAELLLEHYPDEKKEALEHLDFAIKEFREMKMQPSLERALRHKDILKA